MTKNISFISLLLIFFLNLQGCKSKTEQNIYSKNQLDSLVIKLDSLSNLKSTKGNAQIAKILAKMLKSNDEGVVLKTYNYFYQIGDTITDLDAINNSLIQRFPKGTTARNVAYQKVWETKNPVEMEAAYTQWSTQFPPENFDMNNKIPYNVTLVEIAKAYIKKNELKAAENTISKFIETPQLAISYYHIASSFREKENKEKTYFYLEKAITALKNGLKYKEISAQGKLNLGYVEQDILTLYAFSLCEDEKYKASIPYFEKLIAQKNFNDDNAILKYTTALSKTKQAKKALLKIENLITKDFGSKEEYKLLKQTYLIVSGNLKGYNTYKKSLEKQIAENRIKKIKADIINEPAPSIMLQTMDGKMVSLADFKGKVVVVDFWATWCQPCKASFPAMQNVKNSYSNKDVQFLFVNTMESGKGSNRITGINKVLKAYKCEEFSVYLDKNVGNEFQATKMLNITAIPYKVIIGKNGNIRYRSIGYDGEVKAEEDKMKAIIDIVKKT